MSYQPREQWTTTFTTLAVQEIKHVESIDARYQRCVYRDILESLLLFKLKMLFEGDVCNLKTFGNSIVGGNSNASKSLFVFLISKNFQCAQNIEFLTGILLRSPVQWLCVNSV